ncbi:MAG TPA: hypothetical protein VK934_00555 [Fimbriimonas sp.]|nr:hypothetical protein [Fimbriimonas sp.]
MGAYYITTDLEVRARFNPVALDEALRLAGLHGGVRECDGIWRAGYSCGPCVYHPTSGLRHLLGIVEGLGSEARTMWDRSLSRRFDMGFQCFDERFWSKWQVSPKLMRRLANVNGNLVVTIYRDAGHQSIIAP